jgi:hypothetical protein
MVFIEIIGEPAVGKTHLSLTFPKPLLIDTTPKREARIIAYKVLGAEATKRYIHIKNYQELVEAINNIGDDVKTVIIDTSSDLQELALEYELQRKDRKQLMPYEYGRLREMVDTDITEQVSQDKNLIFISQMDDEYIEGKRTGRRIPKGYKRAAFQADIRLLLYLAPETGTAGELEISQYGLSFAYRPAPLHGKLVRKAAVIKNRYTDPTAGLTIIENPTAEKIKQLIPEEIRRFEWIE